MGRLRQMPARLPTLGLRNAPTKATSDAERLRLRDAENPNRAWYKTARWQALRWSVLVRDLFTCQRCKRVVGDTSQLVGDHIVPHRFDETLFWDETNVQCLCKPCHDKDKQREERGRW